MPATIRTTLHTAIVTFVALSFSGDALAISNSCKDKSCPDRTATNAFFKGFTPRYTMGECMVRLKLNIQKGAKEAAVEHQIAKEFRNYLYTNAPTAAAHYFEPGRDGYHYMMYVNACPRRFEITKAMLQAVQPCFQGEANIEMYESQIEPGPRTFEPTTTEWTDSIPE